MHASGIASVKLLLYFILPFPTVYDPLLVPTARYQWMSSATHSLHSEL
jgi:hypothetical protein